VFVQQKRIKTVECALDCAFDTEKRKQNIGMDGVQELLICKLKGPGGSSIQWGLLNSYDEVNPTSLFDYNVQPKKTNKCICFILGNVISSLCLSRFDFNRRSVALFIRTTWNCYQQNS